MKIMQQYFFNDLLERFSGTVIPFSFTNKFCVVGCCRYSLYAFANASDVLALRGQPSKTYPPTSFFLCYRSVWAHEMPAFERIMII